MRPAGAFGASFTSSMREAATSFATSCCFFNTSTSRWTSRVAADGAMGSTLMAKGIGRVERVLNAANEVRLREDRKRRLEAPPRLRREIQLVEGLRRPRLDCARHPQLGCYEPSRSRLFAMADLSYWLGMLASWAAGVLGIYVSFHPPVERNKKWSCFAAFVVLACLGTYASYRQDQEESSAEARRDDAIGRIDEQTKQAPSVVVSVPRISGSPLPVYILKEDADQCWDDEGWEVLGKPVEINWADMADLDAFVDLEVRTKECGNWGQARLFDKTSNRAAVEGPKTRKGAGCGGGDLQRLLLPRSEGRHQYEMRHRQPVRPVARS